MRHLPPALKTHLDATIFSPETCTPTMLLVHAVMACVGVKEVGADNHGPLVELFQAAITRPQGQSWCLDFIQACIAYTEVTLNVQSPLPATELCLDLWNRAKNYQGVTPPKLGDIIIWQFGETIHGHTGIILREDSLRYTTIEGNTSDDNAIDANGDGVYIKHRAKGGSNTFKQLGFLRAFP